MRIRVLACALVLACNGAPGAAPALDFGANTPNDLRLLASSTLQGVAEAFPGRHRCLDDVELVGAWELEDRAQYDPDGPTVTVRIPATAAQLETSIVHELAHHLEFACPEHAEVRGPFLVAQGLEADTDWFGGSSWETTPSEQWATAVVEHVLDRLDESAGVKVTPAGLDVIARWAVAS